MTYSAGQPSAPPPPYGSPYPQQYPPPYGPGYAPPQGPPRRPGNATAAGIVGIVYGVLLFPSAALSLIGAATATDSDVNDVSGIRPVLWIVGILGVLAAVTTFVGAIQMLTGANAFVQRIGALLAIAAIWVLAIWSLTEIEYAADRLSTVIITSACVASVFPALVLGLSLSPSIGRWLTRKKAYSAANGL